MTQLILVFLTTATAQTPAASPATVSLKTVLPDLTDLAALPEFPDPPYTCKQFSSYDRASKSPDDAKGWFANGDWNQFLRTEKNGGRNEWVMADMDGPGAIVRIWSANPKGVLRIYFDGNDTPVIEYPMDRLLGGHYPGVPEPIACEQGRGWNCYLPIPYAKHCKVTSDSDGFYYHVDYRTYPAATEVKPFSMGDLDENRDAIRRAAAVLVDPLLEQAATPHWLTHGGDLRPGGGSEYVVPIVGEQAIRQMWIKLDATDRASALRKVVLRIDCDDERCVESPVGDYFSTVPDVNPYVSLPISVAKDGRMQSRWVMPFARNASISLTSHDAQRVQFTLLIEAMEHKWTDRSMHFFARWQPYLQVPTRPFRDFNYCDISGQGVFVGAAFAIANPAKNWWGEGDEKFYVDGEAFPSWFGTGSEDYFAYAWGCSDLFMHAYHSQPRCDGPGNYGHSVVNRWHIADRVPFDKSFKFDMELWHWADKIKVDMSTVTYWYARPGAICKHPPIKPEELAISPLPPYAPPKVKGAIEGEAMRIVERSGDPGPQVIEACSDEKQLWWRGGKPGDKLVLGFSVADAGKYRVLARCLKAGDYGIIALKINGVSAGEPIDFYNDGIKVSDEIKLGEFDLAAGENQLTATIQGANPKAVKGYMFGLDYVRLEPAR